MTDAGMPPPGPALSPVQREVLDTLGAPPDARPSFDPQLARDLREQLEDRLAPLVEAVGADRPLWLSKHDLAGVHGCEEAFLADADEPFAWSAATARGVIAHKAIELSLNWRGEATPGDLVDEAIARSVGEDSLGTWIGALGEGDRAELRGEATERVAKFAEVFPPLAARWVPVTESRMRVELCADRIVLAGKTDLTVGRPNGSVAGKVVIDLKSGGFVPAHRDDLRFYALIETLRLGVPPRLLASVYLDSGRIVTEDVDEAVLDTAVERTVRGAEALVALRNGDRAPTLRPGPGCRWCRRRPDCEVGQGWLEARAEQDGW